MNSNIIPLKRRQPRSSQFEFESAKILVDAFARLEAKILDLTQDVRELNDALNDALRDDHQRCAWCVYGGA